MQLMEVTLLGWKFTWLLLACIILQQITMYREINHTVLVIFIIMDNSCYIHDICYTGNGSSTFTNPCLYCKKLIKGWLCYEFQYVRWCYIGCIPKAKISVFILPVYFLYTQHCTCFIFYICTMYDPSHIKKYGMLSISFLVLLSFYS